MQSLNLLIVLLPGLVNELERFRKRSFGHMLANQRTTNLERISITRESGIAARLKVQNEDLAHGVQQMEIGVVIISVGSIVLLLSKKERNLQRSNRLHLAKCGSVSN